MIKAGLCSVTFRAKSPKEIINLAVKAGIHSIEWASDAHVYEGNVALAEEVRKMTEDAGLEVSSYGSYYRLGMKNDIIPYLESAKALGAPEIRVWAGYNPSYYHLFDARQALVQEAKEISRKAAEYGITISTECHANTLTDTLESLIRYMFEVNEPNFCTYWQALDHIPDNEQLHVLKTIYTTGKLTNLHVYHFDFFGADCEQKLLSEAYDKWLERLMIFGDDSATRHAMLEFVRDGSEENFMADSETLLKLVNEANAACVK